MKALIRKLFPDLMDELHEQKLLYQYRQKKKYTPEQIRQELSRQYQANLGVPLNLDHPVRYTEKIQWTKLYGVTETMSRLSDKYRVREWVKETIGEEYLLPLITAVKHYEEIDFDKLPNRFVIKSNNSSGWNILVRDKSKLNKRMVKRNLDRWSKVDYAYYANFEMQYSPIEPVFLIEEFVNDHNGELNDYKFLCFNGVPVYCWVDTGRFVNHTRTTFDMNWQQQELRQSFEVCPTPVPKPKNFEKMVELATTLCQGFPHVRVDLYNVDGKIYFGEMTFTNGDGLERFYPDEYDTILGNMFPLPEKQQ